MTVGDDNPVESSRPYLVARSPATRATPYAAGLRG